MLMLNAGFLFFSRLQLWQELICSESKWGWKADRGMEIEFVMNWGPWTVQDRGTEKQDKKFKESLWEDRAHWAYSGRKRKKNPGVTTYNKDGNNIVTGILSSLSCNPVQGAIQLT